LGTKSVSISADNNLLGGGVHITGNNKILLVATEKTGHEFNAEKPEHIFLTVEGNVRRMS
jgi:hypothetical protein